MAQPVASLMNALKNADLTGSEGVLLKLAGNLTKFYKALPQGFDKLSYTLKEIRPLIDIAKQSVDFNPEINPITALAESFKQFNGIKMPNLSDFAQGVAQILAVLRNIPKDTVINTEPLKQLLDTLAYADASMQNAQAILAAVRSIGDVNKLDTSKF